MDNEEIIKKYSRYQFNKIQAWEDGLNEARKDERAKIKALIDKFFKENEPKYRTKLTEELVEGIIKRLEEAKPDGKKA